LKSFWLAPWASRRRQDLLELMDRLNPAIQELTAAVEKEAIDAILGLPSLAIRCSKSCWPPGGSTAPSRSNGAL